MIHVVAVCIPRLAFSSMQRGIVGEQQGSLMVLAVQTSSGGVLPWQAQTNGAR